MAAKKPATKGADVQAAKPKPRTARKPGAPKKPAEHPVTAASELAHDCDFFIVVLGNFRVTHSLGRRYQGALSCPHRSVF